MSEERKVRIGSVSTKERAGEGGDAPGAATGAVWQPTERPR